jgi:hypothetical protein
MSMAAPLVLAGMLLLLLAPPRPAAAPAAPSPGGGVTVTIERVRHSTVIGSRFSFESRLANPGNRPTAELIAHLNVASLTSDVYVDPEDWSAERTIQVPPLPPGGATSLAWDLQAVNAGRFAVYVVVLPREVPAGRPDALAVSPPMHVEVAGRRTLNVGGALPVVISIPVALGLLAVSVRRRGHRPA